MASVVVASAAWLGTAFVGADEPAAAPAESVAKQPVFETPEACFEAWANAQAERDIAGLLACMSERDQKIQVGWMAHFVELELFHRTKKMEAAIEFRKRYGMENMDVMGMMQEDDPIGVRGGPFRALEFVGGKVKDRAQFMKDGRALLDEGKEPPPETAKTEEEEKERPKLSDLKIDGDSATGSVKMPGLDKEAPMLFIKENGSWAIASERPKKAEPKVELKP